MGCFLLVTQKDVEQIRKSCQSGSSRSHNVAHGRRGSIETARRGTRQSGRSRGRNTAHRRRWSLEEAKQEMWRRAAEDPKLGKDIRGWVKHQLNQQERMQRAKREGRRPPGGNPYRIKAPPSYDAGHKIPGIHRPENLRPELRSMNRARPGIARRLGIENYR